MVTPSSVECGTSPYSTQYVILVVIDGPRMSETWEHPEQKYIPYLSGPLRKKAVINREFYNLGNTFTVPGHIALTTGSYEFKTNDGSEYPSEASVFQMYLSCAQTPPSDAYIITSKEKLNVLGDCENLSFRNSFRPSVDALDRPDIETYERAINILETEEPSLSLIHFKGPDTEGHHGDWEGYLEAIVETDSLLNELINFIEGNEYYKGKTSVIMTNDHGRHLDGIADGFKSHGDHCRGCTHINFMAYGPDFKSDELIYTEYESIDIVPTITALMGFDSPYTSGKIMTDLFKKVK